MVGCSTIHIWLVFATMPADSTRTILFGIFVLAGRPLTTGQVVALSKPLGISPTNVKSHLTRMVAEGALRRSGPRRFARYWPTADRQHVIQGIAARLETPEAGWDERWLMLTLQMPSRRSARNVLRESLWFDGFRPWGSDTYIRPAWPERWALDRAQAYLARGAGLCVHGTLLGAVDLKRVRKMYDLDGLDHEAGRLARAITAKRAGTRSAAGAFAARLHMSGLVARLIAHDPRLPPTIWASRTGLRDLVRAYQRFETYVSSRAQQFLNEVLEGGAAATRRRTTPKRWVARPL